MLSRWIRLMEMLMGEASCSDKIKKLSLFVNHLWGPEAYKSQTF